MTSKIHLVAVLVVFGEYRLSFLLEPMLNSLSNCSDYWNRRSKVLQMYSLSQTIQGQ